MPSDLQKEPPSPLSAVLGLVFVGAAVLLGATRFVGEIQAVEIDLVKTEKGWHAEPDPKLAKVTPSTKRADALDCTYLAPTAQGEELYVEIATLGKDGTTLLPGAPIQAGWNQVLLEPASQFLSVRLKNTLWRLPRPAVAVLRGGPTRPAHPPEATDAIIAAAAALAGALVVGTLGSQRAVLHLGLVLLLLSGGAVALNEHTPYRAFISGEAARLALVVATGAALLSGVRGGLGARLARANGADTTLPSMGGARG